MFDWSVADNLALPSLGARHGLAFVRRRANRTAATTAISRFGIVGRPEQTVRTLSGGNQQKLSLSKWMHGSATLLLADEPTRGVDVRGRRLIHEMLLAFAAAGNAFVMYSTDPEELEATCSRVVIVNDGRLTGRELVDDEITVERLEAIAHIHNPALAS
jgi:ABC-type sugar transport system ATPase subunit